MFFDWLFNGCYLIDGLLNLPLHFGQVIIYLTLLNPSRNYQTLLRFILIRRHEVTFFFLVVSKYKIACVQTTIWFVSPRFFGFDGAGTV